MSNIASRGERTHRGEPALPARPASHSNRPREALIQDTEPQPEPEPELAQPLGNDSAARGSQHDDDDDDGSDRDDDRSPMFYHDDDALKDGCAQCPPTCVASKTFLAHLIRAIFPFVFLGELSYRWCRRKCDRQCMDARELKATSEEPFITVRRLAECVGRLFHMVLVYMVLCNSLKIHGWIKSIFGDGAGTDQWLKLFVGADPAEQQNHAYVDVAISETFYPLWVFLLLAALFAHEETSYPRRTRVEYSVETDSLLLRWVSLMKQLEIPEDRDVGVRAKKCTITNRPLGAMVSRVLNQSSLKKTTKTNYEER